MHQSSTLQLGQGGGHAFERLRSAAAHQRRCLPLRPRFTAQCGTAKALRPCQAMPSGTAHSAPAAARRSFASAGPSSFTWTCLSLTGGTEANCYATRVASAYTVTAPDSGGNRPSGCRRQPSRGGGSSATVTATAAILQYCRGPAVAAPRTAIRTPPAPIQATCTVTAELLGSAPAVVNGSCGIAERAARFSVTPTAGLTSGATAPPP